MTFFRNAAVGLGRKLQGLKSPRDRARDIYRNVVVQPTALGAGGLTGLGAGLGLEDLGSDAEAEYGEFAEALLKDKFEKAVSAGFEGDFDDFKELWMERNWRVFDQHTREARREMQ